MVFEHLVKQGVYSFVFHNILHSFQSLLFLFCRQRGAERRDGVGAVAQAGQLGSTHRKVGQ